MWGSPLLPTLLPILTHPPGDSITIINNNIPSPESILLLNLKTRIPLSRKNSTAGELAGEDQLLLIRRDPFLIWDLGFDVVDGVEALNLEHDYSASESFDEDLHVV